jgi:hypothetical protein
MLGGVDELASQLQDDEIQYAVVRLSGIQDQRGNPTTRDVFLTSIGAGVGIIEKGKKMPYMQDAQRLLQPFHTAVTVSAIKNLNRER